MVLFLAGFPAKAEDAGPPDDTAPPELDMDREIAWAKRRWPEALSNVRFDSLAPKLMEWVPKGKTRMGYLGGTCEPVRLSRAEGPTGERLEGHVFEKPTRDNGRRKRRYRLLYFAREYRAPCVGGEEVESPNGNWTHGIGWACGEEDRVRGVLSYVDRKVAKFTGESVGMGFTCWDSVTSFHAPGSYCASDKPDCHHCSALFVYVRSKDDYSTTPNDHPPKKGTEDWSQKGSDFARLLRLENARKAWRPRPSARLPKTDPPVLYRHQADCLRVGLRRGR
jgi:hypothetical protein